MTELERPDTTPRPPIPTHPQAICQWAHGALSDGWAGEALQLWNAAQRSGATDLAVEVAIALLEAEIGDWEAVRVRVQRVLERDPANPLAGCLSALAAFRLGDIATAAVAFQTHGLFAAAPLVRLFIRIFAETVREHPERFPFPIDGGPRRTADSPEGKPTAEPTPISVPLWRRFLQGGGFGPDSASRALVVRGDRLLSKGRIEEALRLFEAAALEDPQNWMARMAVGLCRIELGDREKALDDLLQLLSDKPDVPNVISAASWGLYHKGEFRRALDLLSTLAPAGPDDWGMHYIALLCLEALGRQREADTILTQALGPYFLDTWEQFVMPLYHRVSTALQKEAETRKADSTERVLSP